MLRYVRFTQPTPSIHTFIVRSCSVSYTSFVEEHILSNELKQILFIIKKFVCCKILLPTLWPQIFNFIEHPGLNFQLKNRTLIWVHSIGIYYDTDEHTHIDIKAKLISPLFWLRELKTKCRVLIMNNDRGLYLRVGYVRQNNFIKV